MAAPKINKVGSEEIIEVFLSETKHPKAFNAKAQWYNRKIVFVDRFYPSSKTCHNCGYINKNLTLKDRQWICPQCGEVIERDYNAALNILDEGLRIIGCSTSEFTLVDYPTVDDPIRNDLLKSSDRLKQEVNNEQVLTYCDRTEVDGEEE
jgi:putative transposase